VFEEVRLCVARRGYERGSGACDEYSRVAVGGMKRVGIPESFPSRRSESIFFYLGM